MKMWKGNLYVREHYERIIEGWNTSVSGSVADGLQQEGIPMCSGGGASGTLPPTVGG